MGESMAPGSESLASTFRTLRSPYPCLSLGQAKILIFLPYKSHMGKVRLLGGFPPPPSSAPYVVTRNLAVAGSTFSTEI
jgi:hypothetical protein